MRSKNSPFYYCNIFNGTALNSDNFLKSSLTTLMRRFIQFLDISFVIIVCIFVYFMFYFLAILSVTTDFITSSCMHIISSLSALVLVLADRVIANSGSVRPSVRLSVTIVIHA